MYILPFLLALLPASEVAPAPHPGVVSAADVRRAVERSLPFVEKSSANWRANSKCVTCHQVPFAVWALNEAKSRGVAVDAAMLDDMAGWAFNFCATNEAASMTASTTFMVLSQSASAPSADALKAYALFEKAFAKRQKPDGSWREGRQIRIEGAQREADEVDTMWTLLAIKSLDRIGDKLSADTRKGLASERDKGLEFLKAAKPGRRIDWLVLRVLIAKEYDTPELAKQLLGELRTEQNADGGWGYVRGGESYAHTTGECLYCLGEMGLGGSDPAVCKAWKRLVNTQQSGGWWQSRTRETFSTKPDLVRATSIHWGTAWATIGMLHTLPAK
jgi:Squalene-hopene cyclase C-terminal domain